MRFLSRSIAAAALCGAILAPSIAGGQSWHSHRQDMKNQWRNLAYGAGAAGLLGILSHNDTLTIGGIAGAAYSGWRYEEERKNQHRHDWNNYDNGYGYGNGYGNGYAYGNGGNYGGGYSHGGRSRYHQRRYRGEGNGNGENGRGRRRGHRGEGD